MAETADIKLVVREKYADLARRAAEEARIDHFVLDQPYGDAR